MSERLSEIEARWVQGTPGPWFARKHHISDMLGTDVSAICHPSDADRGFNVIVRGVWNPDADKIGHAPEDIAWLMAEVRRLTTERAALAARVKDLEYQEHLRRML